jgi:hypothetical protein
MGEDIKWVRLLLLLLILCPLLIATVATAWLLVREVMDAGRLVKAININMSMPYTERLITIAVSGYHVLKAICCSIVLLALLLLDIVVVKGVCKEQK